MSERPSRLHIISDGAVFVTNGDLLGAMKVFKKQLASRMREFKRQLYFTPPSERRRIKHSYAIRRRQRLSIN